LLFSHCWADTPKIISIGLGIVVGVAISQVRVPAVVSVGGVSRRRPVIGIGTRFILLLLKFSEN